VATYTWNVNSGAFNAAGSWNPAVVPGAADTAAIGTGSGTISGTGAVAQLNFNPGGPWTLTGTVAAGAINVNDQTTVTGAGLLTLTNTSLFVANGANTTGTLTISGGGTVNSTAAATTAVAGLYVGGGSTATGAVGTLTVTGTGSSLSTGSNAAIVGQVGSGTLNVLAGATASFASSNSNVFSALGVGRSGTGAINVSGAGSSVTANGFVYIGRAGTGTLTVDQGASFTGGAAASGSVGSFSVAIGDGSPTLDSNGNPNSPLYFGGSGSAQVTNGSTLHSLGSLRVGYRGSAGTLTVGSTSSALADQSIYIGSSGGDRTGAVGSVTVQGAGLLKSGGTHTVGNAGIVLGNDAGTTGTLTVTGSNSIVDANGDRLTVGGNGTGTLTISAGGKALAGASYSDVEAAFAVGGGAGAVGTVSITGPGSQLIASGGAVIGGNEKGAGAVAGGIGTVSVTSGGLLQTGALTIEARSKLTVDQSSTLTTPSINLNGGTADLYTLTTATAISFGTAGMLRVHAVTGANTLANFTFGDTVDVAAGTSVSLSGNTLTVGSGSINLGASPANSSYQLFSDGSGGTFAALTPKTIGVYRFFDKSYGTHFYTADANEAAAVAANRSDLVAEGPGGIGLQAVAVSASDPSATAVYRFFDTIYGTHFFTASVSERDTIIASRSDLTYESSSTFYEHTAAQPGDTAVYRYFDNVRGTHFYTDSASEQAGIAANRPDLVAEGIGFYEPAQNYARALS